MNSAMNFGSQFWIVYRVKKDLQVFTCRSSIDWIRKLCSEETAVRNNEGGISKLRPAAFRKYAGGIFLA